MLMAFTLQETRETLMTQYNLDWQRVAKHFDQKIKKETTMTNKIKLEELLQIFSEFQFKAYTAMQTTDSSKLLEVRAKLVQDLETLGISVESEN